jgi:hypothetical protein
LLPVLNFLRQFRPTFNDLGSVLHITVLFVGNQTNLNALIHRPLSLLVDNLGQVSFLLVLHRKVLAILILLGLFRVLDLAFVG